MNYMGAIERQIYEDAKAARGRLMGTPKPRMVIKKPPPPQEPVSSAVIMRFPKTHQRIKFSGNVGIKDPKPQIVKLKRIHMTLDYRVSLVLRSVAKKHSIEAMHLTGETRLRLHSRARFEAICRMKDKFGIQDTRIARIFNRDRSSITHAIATHRKRMAAQ